MNIELIILSIIGVLFLLIIIKKIKKNPNPYISKIEPYLTQELGLDTSIIFLNHVRQFNIYLINLKQNKKLHSQLEKPTYDLLGLILKIPRLSNQNQDLLEAITQITTISESTVEIKKFLSKNLARFKQYL